MLNELRKELQKAGNPEKAKIFQKFFKTGKGEYGEGAIFLGINLPVQKEIAKKYDLGLDEIQELLDSPLHDERVVGLLILREKYNYDEASREKIFNFYLDNASNMNNWDLVDMSAPRIVGNWLIDKPKDVLLKLAESDNLWEKRIAIVSTFAFIRENNFDETLIISEMLLDDSHDLIHKAVGWMLREVGKRNQDVLEDFLKKHYKVIPRTMLRYAIERFEEGKRQKYLKGEI